MSGGQGLRLADVRDGISGPSTHPFRLVCRASLSTTTPTTVCPPASCPRTPSERPTCRRRSGNRTPYRVGRRTKPRTTPCARTDPKTTTTACSVLSPRTSPVPTGTAGPPGAPRASHPSTRHSVRTRNQVCTPGPPSPGRLPAVGGQTTTGPG